VALEALRGDLTVAEIAGKYQIHPNLVQQWKKKLQESASDVFMTKAERKAGNNTIFLIFRLTFRFYRLYYG
jgi:transposase-like protein